jgi:hypothetical protein
MILTTGQQSQATKHSEGVTFQCGTCHEVKPIHTNGGTGYAVGPNDKLVCYDCCGKQDRQAMINNGKIALYLCKDDSGKYKVSNWPGTITFPCHTRIGHHNIAGVRYDCWFAGPDGYQWHGITYGDNTQICHCKRTKVKAT